MIKIMSICMELTEIELAQVIAAARQIKDRRASGALSAQSEQAIQQFRAQKNR